MTWEPIKTAPKDGRTILAGFHMEGGLFTFDVVQSWAHEFDGGDFGVTRNIAPYTLWHDVAEPPAS